ncbi:hypothetical protein ENBRE01_1713 [Enteropsectra breve]|nr:hypothetical protein ENBRE01_1713 [Enteropsectra breve]
MLFYSNPVALFITKTFLFVYQMILKVVAYNSKKELLFRRIYDDCLTDEEIITSIDNSPECNFINGTHSLIYKTCQDFTVALVVRDENEMYTLNIISILLAVLETEFGDLCSEILIYNFIRTHQILDSYILNGKIVSLDINQILNRL